MGRLSLPVLLPEARLPHARGAPLWLELALDYRCNLRCLGCHACVDTGESMSTTAAVHALRRGRQRGLARLWLGGGEPTLRADLLGLVRLARSLGYEQVLLQTNGLRLSYGTYRDAVIDAGVTEVRLNVKSHRAEVQDRLGRGESHALLLATLEGLAGRREVTVSADVLLTRSGLPDLPDLVPFYAARGVARFVLWLLSAADVSDEEVGREVPTFREIEPQLAKAARNANALGVILESLHTPPCTLPPSLRGLYLPAASLGLTVTGPDGRSFPLETSTFEGGAYVEACEACAERQRCGGPRADYLRLHGSSEIITLRE
jgi:MoaA/NifB/PqqE/SkfB family radical SAM enzyme